MGVIWKSGSPCSVRWAVTAMTPCSKTWSQFEDRNCVYGGAENRPVTCSIWWCGGLTYSVSFSVKKINSHFRVRIAEFEKLHWIFMFCWPCCHLGIILVNDQLDAQFFFCVFISILYMFRATSCSSSGDSIVLIQPLVFVTLCRWAPSMQAGKEFLPDLHTRRSPTQSDTYQMLYWYDWFSWWWARGNSKHVENWNKHTEKELCVKLVIYKSYIWFMRRLKWCVADLLFLEPFYLSLTL
jgi:hypothetical protein